MRKSRESLILNGMHKQIHDLRAALELCVTPEGGPSMQIFDYAQARMRAINTIVATALGGNDNPERSTPNSAH